MVDHLKLCHNPGLCIETSYVYDFSSGGETQMIDCINPSITAQTISQKDEVILLTECNYINQNIESSALGVAIFLDSSMTVTKIINSRKHRGATSLFHACSEITIPKGGFAILAITQNDEMSQIRYFFEEKFKIGDMVRLKLNDLRVTLSDILQLDYHNNKTRKPFMTLDYMDMTTTYKESVTVSGVVYNAICSKEYTLVIRKYNSQGTLVSMSQFILSNSQEFSTFSGEVALEQGVNYIDVWLSKNHSLIKETKKSLVIYRKKKTIEKKKPVIMWVEKYANVKTLYNIEQIETMIVTAKDSGVTDFAMDVKGCEGYVAYKKSSLSNTPYMTEIKNPRKQTQIQIDFLEEFIRISHNYGMKVYASFNFFTEGNLLSKDSAMNIPTEHPEWAEILQAPEDNGELKSIFDTNRESIILYVNPANSIVQDLQFRRVEEVLLNYKIDGIIMDRTRYDHQYADFSNETKIQFEEYLLQRNKKLEQWPVDIYKILKDGTMEKGKYYIDWITFRSLIIKNFSTKLRTLVNHYRIKYDKEIELGAYVGSWYESYYQNGVNWASQSFQYNERLKFPISEIYTEEYSRTSYLTNIDFLMIGCYYDTKEEIEKYVTLANIVTNEEISLIGSISIPSLKSPKALQDGFQTVYQKSDGSMIFDLCYTDWKEMKIAIKKGNNIEY